MPGALIWLVVGVVVVGVVVLVVRAADREQARLDASRDRGEPATARVVAVVGNRSSLRQAGGVSSGYDVTLELVRVGRPTTQVTVPWYVGLLAAPAVQPGAELAVRVDPADDRLVYPEHADIEPERATLVRLLRDAGR